MLDDDASTTQDQIVYKAPYHAGVMVDPHLDKIKAAGWTSIIRDNKSLRKLLQTYFLTEFKFFPAFQKRLFSTRHDIRLQGVLLLPFVPCNPRIGLYR